MATAATGSDNGRGRFAAVTDKDPVVLVPAMESPVQVIDVEDLATWLVSAADTGTAGVFDAVGDAVDQPH